MSHSLTQLKEKYTGAAAQQYEAWRSDSAHWKREQKLVRSLLASAGAEDGSVILDVPVGTGRFLPFYEAKACTTLGVDASPDMLAEARARAAEIEYDDVTLQQGNILDLDLADDRADVSVCIRMMNWLDAGRFRQALDELRRVTRRRIIVGVRMATGRTRTAVAEWLRKAPNAWMHRLANGLHRMRRWMMRADAEGSGEDATASSASPSSSEEASPSNGNAPTLVDHPEKRVRRAFRARDLTVQRERHALTFRTEPRLSNGFQVEERAYRIFLLQV